MQKQHATRIPQISSKVYTDSFLSHQKMLLPEEAAAQHQLQPPPSRQCSGIGYSRINSLVSKMIKLGESMDVFARGVREHVRLGPKLSDTVRGKMRLGARILQVGGVEKVFNQKFDIGDDEKLLKVSQCYLSTTGGPIAGLLFVSNDRVAFCSERCIKLTSPTGNLFKLHYKVTIPLTKIKKAIENENFTNPAQKYVQLVTQDNFDFWFMGFLNHQRTLKYLHQAIHQAK